VTLTGGLLWICLQVHLLRPGEKPPSKEAMIAKFKAYLKPLEVGTWKEGGEGADGHRVLKKVS